MKIDFNRSLCFLLAASLVMASAACEPIAFSPYPSTPQPPDTPRLSLRADGSYLKDGKVYRTSALSDLVRDHPEARKLALEYERNKPIARGLLIAGLTMTVTGGVVMFPGLIAQNDPVAVVGGVHAGIGLLVLTVQTIFDGAPRWEQHRAIDLYNESAPPLSPLVPRPLGSPPWSAPLPPVRSY
ncbi:hypothetical protein [Polyangium jinanense]|uniref:Uncharacterized protein n=1 Tax=Polyangium jinanense TaxID=2829994 RepID=A0A9X3XGK5_9BACT|nr:hypothetical protein [Polyangium jinanense]MDC3962927.1 hypothetical protein [Polyangium jinanense]MDC3989070.1 hypothetical protein [Polyangium jinanense]